MKDLVEKWEKTGLLYRLTVQEKDELATMLEEGATMLVKWANDIDVKGVVLKSSEDFAGIFLPAISRNYRLNYKPFNVVRLAEKIQTHSKLFEDLKSSAENPNKTAIPRYTFDYEVEFLDRIIK